MSCAAQIRSSDSRLNRSNAGQRSFAASSPAHHVKISAGRGDRNPPATSRAMLAEFVRCHPRSGPGLVACRERAGRAGRRGRWVRSAAVLPQRADCGCRQNRHRYFQFGSRDGVGLVFDQLPPAAESRERCCLASEGTRTARDRGPTSVELQGLPQRLLLARLDAERKYRAVGNGVPIRWGASSRSRSSDGTSPDMRVCVCGCGRVPPANRRASAACRSAWNVAAVIRPA